MLRLISSSKEKKAQVFIVFLTAFMWFEFNFVAKLGEIRVKSSFSSSLLRCENECFRSIKQGLLSKFISKRFIF